MDNKRASGFLIVVGLFLVFGCGFGGCFLYRSTETVVTITVTGRDRVSYGSGDDLSHKYLIYTDGETFEVTDSIAYGRWNSSDVYGRLQPGQTYTVTVAGWRMPFFSSYRNIIRIH